MNSERGTGVMDTGKELAPALTGNPAAVWHAAREGTRKAASVLPDALGLDRVRHFIQRHPVVSTLAVLGVSYFFLRRGRFGLVRGRR
jgi:hypothetical protein